METLREMQDRIKAENRQHTEEHIAANMARIAARTPQENEARRVAREAKKAARRAMIFGIRGR
jgi:hypothetical protein